MDYGTFLKKLEESGNHYDIPKIESAFEIADAAHQGQSRRSGEAYVTHPLEVAAILLELGMDTDCICAALLHDTIEDTSVSYADIKKGFGETVADLVSGVTKIGNIPFSSREEAQMENLRKMILATAKDVRVVLIKLADRLHNMRTMDSMPPQKQLQKSLETMEVYAPLAHRLGMQRWKIELEDLALRYLDPYGFAEIENAISLRKNERDDFLNGIIANVKERFGDSYINVKISGRVKHTYSIYRKMFTQNKSFDEIYDLFAIRIIVENMNECYNVLGIIHDMYKPIPGRFKDYISTPKPNMYQSLHTTVIGKEGIPFEVQIRTFEMHHTAEYGIAAHWKYKQGLSKKDALDGKLDWVQKLVHNEAADPEEFMRPFKIDFFADEVFVFTPGGDLISLPAGSTVIDFAYAIHSAVGNRMIGAKVNGKMVNLDYQVKNGEIVEIIKSGHVKGPSRDWLNIAKTSEAKSKIRTWFKKERREENIATGKEMLAEALRHEGIRYEQEQLEEELLPIAKRIGFTGVEELYAGLGYGGVSLSRILPKLKEEYQKLRAPEEEEELPAANESKPKRRTGKGVIVEGVENCLIKYARCCNPLPGDDIIGYITKGYGISVHRTDCVNVKSSLARGDENDRWLRVTWSGSPGVTFPAEIVIVANKRVGLLADITTALANLRVFIHAVNAREVTGGRLQVSIRVDAPDVEYINSIIKKLRQVQSVLEIRRGSGM